MFEFNINSNSVDALILQLYCVLSIELIIIEVIIINFRLSYCYEVRIIYANYTERKTFQTTYFLKNRICDVA